MKKSILFFLAAIVSSCCTAQSEAETKAWMDYMTPGEVHKMMAKWDGEWTETMTMWMAPGAPAEKNTATCVNKMILGGRYQSSSHTGNFNGMAFEGLSTVAYDNIKKKFISTWLDNFGTGILIMEGTWDAATKTMHSKGKQIDPTTGKEDMVRETFQVIDDNTQKIEMFKTPAGGKEFKTMEVLFTRKK